MVPGTGMLIRAILVLLAADLAYELAQASGAIGTRQTPDRLVAIACLLVGVVMLGRAPRQPLSRIAPIGELVALPLLAGALAVACHLTFDSYHLPRHVRIVSEQGWGVTAFGAAAGIVGAGAVIAWGTRRPDRARWWLALSLTCAVFSIWFSFVGH